MSAPDARFARLPAISLDELNASARLMTRVDRKYFVPRAVLAQVLAGEDGYRALEIDGVRAFRYRTVYFDSPRFAFYRQHVQGRRHRYKVRTRTYCDSGDCLLEVKAKGYRGQTVKQRIAHDPRHPAALDAEARAYIAGIVGTDAAARPVGADSAQRPLRAEAAQLRPVLETVYHRTTLVHDESRVTLDVDLEAVAGSARVQGPGDVLVETKSAGGAGPLDRALLRAGVRPHTVSKYCCAAALLYPHLPHNPWTRTLRRYFTVACQ
ncbi:polyphosphate polymerase domain-containing protein [Microbacterium luticocti]|uniref:polyphosphate polymerase domain-containing protein n=1 Tax=Microbacterium luticocti TaxID=451764 RepID=UPI0004035CBB|nr:polyphosphate polymerase domain-containing protein [Microbacterium luticocti]